MTKPKLIEITVDPAGKSTLQTQGFAGQGCKDASRFLERALGQVTSDRATPEMHQAAGQQIGGKQ